MDLSVHEVLRLKDEFDHPEFLTYNPLKLAVSQAIAYQPSIVVIRNLDDLPYGMIWYSNDILCTCVSWLFYHLEHDKPAVEKFMTILCDQIARLKDEMQVCTMHITMTQYGFSRNIFLIQVCIIGLACELQQVPDPMQKNDIFGEHIHIPIPTM